MTREVMMNKKVKIDILYTDIWFRLKDEPQEVKDKVMKMLGYLPVEEIHKTEQPDLREAVRKAREELIKELDEPCPHILTQIMDGAETKKRECEVCWQSIKGGNDEPRS